MSLRWTQSLTNDIDSTCVRVETQADDQRTVYRIEAPSLNMKPDEGSVITPGLATVSTPTQQRFAKQGFAETISVPEKSSVERVIVEWKAGRGVLYLPSAPFLEACEVAIRGDQSAAKSVLDSFQSPVLLPLLCGAFLDIDDVINLVEAVTDAHRHTASTIHSYRYPILRSALVNSTGLSISSASDFEALVDGFDSIEAIGSVSLIDCVADTMLTIHESVTETDDLLASLGYEPAAFEQRQDGRFFACYLAHAVLTDGVSAARGHAMQRRRHLDVNYERGKIEARNAPRHERGRKWRCLICAAARESKGEFAYVLSNALYWTGHATHSDSRIQELLYRGASAVVDLINLPELAGWALFECQLTAGHRLRSRNQFAAAKERFIEARQIAQRYNRLPEWQARYNEVVVRAHDKKDAGCHKAALHTIDSGIEALLQYDLRPESATRIVHHLKGQSCEIEAESVKSSSPEKARSLLAEASDHYDVIDFTRSRDRTNRKRKRIHRSRTGLSESSPNTGAPVESGSDGGESTTDTKPSNVESTSGGSSATDSSASQPAPVAQAKGGEDSEPPSPPRKGPESFPEPDSYPNLDDSLTPHDETKIGSGDIMSGPDAQQSDPNPFDVDDSSEPDWY